MKTEYIVVIEKKSRVSGTAFISRRVFAKSEDNARHIVANYGSVVFVGKV